MNTNLSEQTASEIKPIVSKDYGIEPLKKTTEAVEFMVRPEWLYKEGTLSFEACPDEDTALEIYAQFFKFANTECQKALFNSLMQVVIHAESAMFNIYDNSMASLNYATQCLEFLVERWRQNISVLVNEDVAKTFTMFIDAFPVVHEGASLNTYEGSLNLKKLSNGVAEFDFLVKHPMTQTQFNRHLLGLSYHALNNKIQVAKIVTESVQNKP